MNTVIHLLYLSIANIFMILNNICVINILKIVSIRRAIKDKRARGNHNCKGDCVANILTLNLQISRNIGQVAVSVVIFNQEVNIESSRLPILLLKLIEVS